LQGRIQAGSHLLFPVAAKYVRSYIFSFYGGIVDLLTVLPIGDANLTIRMLRIVRLRKLVRYLRVLCCWAEGYRR